MTPPLVTCICPTAGRREFLRRAIALFAAQDYPRKRLLIVEDGAEHNGDLVPADIPSAYMHLGAERRTIGEKRNIACEKSPDGLIAHWDDDDWHSPKRLSAQIAAMQQENADLCGLDRLIFFDGKKAWLFQCIDANWLAGGSLIYKRSLWEAQPFERQSNGEDTTFVRTAWVRDTIITAVGDEKLYVARVHAGNSAPKAPDCQWIGYDAARVRRMIGEGAAALGVSP